MLATLLTIAVIYSFAIHLGNKHDASRFDYDYHDRH